MRRTVRFAISGYAAVAFFSFAAYILAVRYGLINLDDYCYLFAHRQESIFDVSEAIWMPLTWLSYKLDELFYGEWWGGYHLTSIVIHSVNAMLVAKYLDLIREKLNIKPSVLPFACALIWAVHPLRCESVILLSSRKDVLSLLCEISACIFWLKGSRRNLVWSCVLFVLGSACKPSIMTFPILCLIVDSLIVRRANLCAYIFPISYMIVLAAFASWQQSAGGATKDMFEQPLWGRLLGAAAAFGVYIRNSIWPQWLALQCVKRWPAMPYFMWPGIILSLVAMAYLIFKTRTYLIKGLKFTKDSISNINGPSPTMAGVLWFVITVAPMLGIVSFGYHAFADRFTYVPSIGISIVLLSVLARCKRIGVLMSSAVVIALMIATVRQSLFWKDDLTAFTHTLEIDGESNALAHANIANYHFEITHDLESCVKEFELAEKYDLRYLASCFEIYVFALCELNRTEEIGEKLSAYEQMIVNLVGEEEWYRAWRGETLGQAKLFVNVYKISKAAWWASAPSTLSLAEQYVKENQATVWENDALWLYLLWRIEIAKHGEDSESAINARNRILQDSLPVSYAQFRYLRGQ